MSLALDYRSASEAVRVSDAPLVLADIYQADIDFAIWQRLLGSEIEKEIKTLLSQRHRFSYRVILRPEDVVDWLRAQWPDCHLDTLQADVQQLVSMFADLFDTTHVGMRLELVDKTLCPLFHVDKVPVRMVTTYHGAPTEWLCENDVNREAINRRQHDKVMRPDATVQVARSGDVLLFKGQDWPKAHVAGVVHRSALATPERRRLLLTLDLV